MFRSARSKLNIIITSKHKYQKNISIEKLLRKWIKVKKTQTQIYIAHLHTLFQNLEYFLFLRIVYCSSYVKQTGEKKQRKEEMYIYQFCIRSLNSIIVKWSTKKF